ncbi:MAG: hypothetical protein ChlgKO_02820 [Chlamydiales bacterium]
MTGQLLQKCYSYQAVIQTASQLQNGNNDVYAFAKTVVDLANASQLSHHDIVQLALHLGMKVFPRHLTYRNHLGSSKAVVAGLPDTWIPFLNHQYFSLAYKNPKDPLEIISVVPAAPGHLPYIVHETPDGCIHSDWFNKIVPILCDISRSDKIKKSLKNTFKNEELTLGQVNTINHFFKEDPLIKIEGVCTECYRVSLPDKGFGVKYLLKKIPEPLPTNGAIKEIRYSAGKAGKTPYVTEIVLANKGMNVEDPNNEFRKTRYQEKIWTMHHEDSKNYSFSSYPRREETHIDAKAYDFNNLELRLPLCKCPR